jgi:hypothetical protein
LTPEQTMTQPLTPQQTPVPLTSTPQSTFVTAQSSTFATANKSLSNPNVPKIRNKL